MYLIFGLLIGLANLGTEIETATVTAAEEVAQGIVTAGTEDVRDHVTVTGGAPGHVTGTAEEVVTVTVGTDHVTVTARGGTDRATGTVEATGIAPAPPPESQGQSPRRSF